MRITGVSLAGLPFAGFGAALERSARIDRPGIACDEAAVRNPWIRELAKQLELTTRNRAGDRANGGDCEIVVDVSRRIIPDDQSAALIERVRELADLKDMATLVRATAART